MADDKTSRNADFIGRVVGDPANPPETRMLSGWFGDAAEKGYRRLYTEAELTSYVDIPDDAILYTEPIRDSQPAGAVLVWIKRDAELKPGGSAASRAARFLQGDVQRDFSTPEKAGFHCVTQVPCGEPTGFTGKCTKEPQVGGAWPCVTAIPLCAEPTGFTGKCTHQPWPNPTRYHFCTILHCPTHDLTHIPHICNFVAQAGAAEPQDAAAKEAATQLPGCGYTKTWGLCETHLLGCNETQPPKCPIQDVSQGLNPCGGPGTIANVAAFGAAAIPQTMGPTIIICCQPSLVAQQCTNVGPACPPTPATMCTQNGPDCQTHLAPNCPTHNPCCTHAGPHCPPTPGIICTQIGPQCPKTNPLLDCTFGCTQFGPQCPSTAAVQCAVQQQPAQPAQFGAGAGIFPQGHGGIGPQLTDILCPTVTVETIRCFVTAPITFSGIECLTLPIQCQRTPLCPTHLLHCPPPPTPACPTRHVPCPSAVVACTLFGPQCHGQAVNPPPPTPACPTRDLACPSAVVACTLFGPQCQGQAVNPPPPQTQFCMTSIQGCPNTAAVLCPTVVQCPAVGAQQFGAAAAAQVSQACQLATPLCPPQSHFVQCPPSPFFHCPPSPFVWCPPSPYFHCPPITQVILCNPSIVDACPTRICAIQ